MQTDVIPHQELTKRIDWYIRENPHLISAHWRAESFRSTEGEPMTIRRAKALNAVLTQCELPVWPGELIVGCGKFHRLGPEYDPKYQARDSEFLQWVGSREFCGHSDHHAPDYPTMLRLGFGGLREAIRGSLSRHTDPERITFLRSMELAVDGASRFIRRYAERTSNAGMMEHLSEYPPRTFQEAVQLVYSFHSMMQIDDRYAMAFGRLDQYLYPFYSADRAAGRLTDELALQILEHFFAKITADEDVQNIAVGGIKPDDGSDATNELSFLILEACRRIGRPGGNVTARIARDTPSAFLEKCAEVIRTGIGYPAVVSDEVMVPALTDLGLPIEDARDYCFVGCIETSIPGKTAPWADSRFNLLKCVNLALFDGLDTVTGEQIGPSTGDPQTWEAFYGAYIEQSRTQLRLHIDNLNAAKTPTQSRAADFTSPLMSALTADCIERGRDLNDGGARYPANHGVAGMGIGVTADALAAVKQFVYRERRFTLDDLRRMLAANFEGCECERQLLLRGAPKYGNDVAEVDDIAVRATHDFGTELLKYRTPQGGFYWGLMAANVQNISAGLEIGASPDGRLAFQPVSDAASPTFGRDTGGITSTIRSVAKLPYGVCHGGNVVNVKLHPSAVEGDAGLKALAALIRTCFRLGGAQLQFNTVDGKVLREAMEHPKEYGDLVVRISGFSAHFATLDRAVQEDVLARTEHADTR